VGAPAVERPEPEHELSKFERLREVVVGAEPEAAGLVVETVGSGQHEDRHAAAGGDDAFGDLVTGRAGNIAVEDSDVVGVDAQQLEGGVVSAEELLTRAWDENADPFTNAVRITVSGLRKRLGEPSIIATVAGVGYRIDTDPETGREGADGG